MPVPRKKKLRSCSTNTTFRPCLWSTTTRNCQESSPPTTSSACCAPTYKTVWGGHPCPPRLIRTLDRRLIYIPHPAGSPSKINFKGGGHECPPHTSWFRQRFQLSRCPLSIYADRSLEQSPGHA